MSKKKIDFSKVAAHVIKTPVQKFVEDSYLPYAHYVIMNRALISDDGLKPVQRRILYAMNQLGLTDKKDFMKAAQIVGETMGKYHPHGDSSIGDALARMGQTFSLRVPLVDVHGSVGFVTGDDPAAPRYWEGRPTAAAMELTDELKEGSVEIGLNYDGKYAEPSMFPIKWPVGLINGSQGIAVGYSSTLVPHNPSEVMSAVIECVKNPNITLERIMEIMPGPDMPTGGVLIGYEGVKEYFETGKGTFSIRGKYEIIPGARGTHQVIFSETPFQVSAEQVIKTIEKGKKDRNRFKEISYTKELSDRGNGFQLSIGIKAGANPDVVLKDIFRWTPLEQKFAVNMNVLEDGIPKINSIEDMLKSFVEYRTECVINKVTYKNHELDRNIERLDGIIKILVDIDKAISIIRNSKDTKSANDELMRSFEVSEEQATFVLSMPLRRLTKADSISINNEIKELMKEREYYSLLLTDKTKLNKHIIKELRETKKVIDDERRTAINNKTEEELKKEEAAIKEAASRLTENVECYVTLLSDGSIMKTDKPYVQERSPTGIVSSVKTKTQENLIFVTKHGGGVRVPVSHIPDDVVMDVNVVAGVREGSITGLGKETFDKSSHGILVVTSSGGVNIVNGGFPSSDEFSFTNVGDDSVVYSDWLEKKDIDKNLIITSSDGYTINIPLEQVRTSNAGAGTVRGIGLGDNATIAGVSIANEATAELVTCSHERIKVTKVSEIPTRNRGARGVTIQKLDKDDEILSAFASDRVVANKDNKSLRLPTASERGSSGSKRTGYGVTLGHYE